MKIRQEIWSPGVGWSTVNEQGSLHQASIVFCQGNIGTNFSRSLYREIKHAFPNAAILFTLSEKQPSAKLYLTALSFENTSFSLFQYHLVKASFETIRKVHQSGNANKEISQLLFCSTFGSEQGERLAAQLQHKFALTSIEKSNSESLSFLGFNQLPKMPTAIGIAFHDQNLNIQINSKPIFTKESAAASSTAMQAVSLPANLTFIESGDIKSVAIPLNYTFLLKR